jgi:hypothetical protein
MTCPSTGTCNPSIAQLNAGPFAAAAVLAGVGWLAHILRIDAFISRDEMFALVNRQGGEEELPPAPHH